MTDGDRQCLEAVAHTAFDADQRRAERLPSDVEARVVLGVPPRPRRAR